MNRPSVGIALLSALLCSSVAVAAPPSSNDVETLKIEDVAAGVATFLKRLAAQKTFVEYRLDFTFEGPGEPGVARYEWEELIVALDPQQSQIYGKYRADIPQPDGTLKLSVEESLLAQGVIRNRRDTMGFIADKHGGTYNRDAYFWNLGFAFSPELQRRTAPPSTIAACLASGQYRLLPKREQVEGAWCHVIEEPDKETIWLDAEHGCLLRRRQTAAGSLDGQAIAASDLRTSDVRLVAEGLWLPFTCEIKRTLEGLGTVQRENCPIQEKLTVKRFATGNAVPGGEYRVEFPPGTVVYDSIAEKAFRVTENGNVPLDQPPNNISKLTGGQSRLMWAMLGNAALIGIVLTLYLRGARRRRRNSTF